MSKKEKEYKVTCIRLADKYILGQNANTKPLELLIYANTPLQGLRLFRLFNKENEYELLEYFEDGIKIEIPTEKRGGNHKSHIVRQTNINYAVDSDLINLLNQQPNRNKFINQSVREKLQKGENKVI